MFLYIIVQKKFIGIKKTVSFTVTVKKINYLGINFIKEAEEFYTRIINAGEGN